jgi:hypothetical protein
MSSMHASPLPLLLTNRALTISLAPHIWPAATPNGDDSDDRRGSKVAIHSEQWTRGWKDLQICCTKKEMLNDFLSFQLADLIDHPMERRHLFSANARGASREPLSSLPIRINQAQGI